MVLFGSPAPGAESATREFPVKAAFLLNFAQFADWPPEAFPDSGSPFVIGVLGKDPFGAALDQVVARETVRRRPVVVRRFREVQDVDACQILYIGDSETPRLAPILAALAGRPLLTVGDAKTFAERGGVIQFVLADNRIRLRINTAAAKAANLSISSQLLRQAEIVEAKSP